VHWSLLFESKDPKHTALLDDMREVFVAVSLWKKVSPTFRTREDLERAKTALDTAKNSILMFTSEPRPLLLRNELTVAQAYSTDAYQAARENPKIKYFLPEEGGTFWTDNFSIPTSSLQAKEAHLFINYFLDGDIARRTALLNHSATPNRTAREGLPAEIKNDPSLYPSPERLKKLPMIDDLGDLLPEMNRLWTELKS
jgi:spermidine/putrescine transport system substrate-binding protein